jgi:hypothetical protein
MTAEEPLNITHMGPKRDVVVCQQLSTVHMGHIPRMFLVMTGKKIITIQSESSQKKAYQPRHPNDC